jgi:hypothetical protein
MKMTSTTSHPLISAQHEALGFKEPVRATPTLLAHEIKFLHPAYDTAAEMFLLPAYDANGRGVEHRTALIACGIVACNEWRGYLTTSRSGTALSPALVPLLTDAVYYYVVPMPDDEDNNDNDDNDDAENDDDDGRRRRCSRGFAGHYKYPLCPSFAHWSFPHGQLPETWPSGAVPVPGSSVTPSNLSPVANARDRGCVVSRSGDEAQGAHLVPRADAAWFRREGMKRYAEQANSKNLHDAMANVVALRPDLHKALDNFKWAFVRKCGFWVPHFLLHTQTLATEYHQRVLTISDGVAPEMLLARFALAILNLVQDFVRKSRGLDIELRVYDSMEPGSRPRITSTGIINVANVLAFSKSNARKRGADAVTDAVDVASDSERRNDLDDCSTADDLVSASRNDNDEEVRLTGFSEKNYGGS